MVEFVPDYIHLIRPSTPSPVADADPAGTLISGDIRDNNPEDVLAVA